MPLGRSNVKELSPPDDRPVVLVVDDEPDTADLYTEFLEDAYTVRTAYSGDEALSVLDSDVSVVLLDRRMPGVSGESVLETIRERAMGCRIVLVTGVSPGLDIMELPFDDYLVKPVTPELLQDAVERMLVRNTHDDRIQAIVALASKMSTLEAKMTIEDMKASTEYAALEGEFENLLSGTDMAEQASDMYTEFTSEKIQALFS